ncbi:MAG TPA: hypothetical protein VEC99_14235 [Clostridia bacterium]|nr:hypothetical protein [Clostridia bacterium]
MGPSAHCFFCGLKRFWGITLLYLAFAPGGLVTPAGAASVQILGIRAATNGNWALIFEGSSTNATKYGVEFTTALQSGYWQSVSNCQISVAGTGVFQADLPCSTEVTRFFRILSCEGSGADSDLDELSDALEALKGTNPQDPDTDDDGFSDGVEVANSTNPLLKSSQPDLSVLTGVSFDQSVVTVSEADGAYAGKLSFSKPFVGSVHYEVDASSTATSLAPGSDYHPLSGTLAVNGTEALLPIQLVDDLHMRGTRSLFLNIRADPVCRYRPSGTSRQLIRIEDNDVYWTGTMRDVYAGTNVGFAELSFRLKLLRSESTNQAWLVNDGKLDSGTKGSGCIPVGEWRMDVTLSTNSFDGVSEPIPMPSLPIFANGEVTRILRLSAKPHFRLMYGFGPGYIAGDYAEETRATDRTLAHLDRTNHVGVFILMRDQPIEATSSVFAP